MATQTKETVLASRVCFFVTPLGDDNSPTRVRADDVMQFILVPALAECGYTTPPVRADQMPNPGRITRQIIDQLLKADLVIADLTDHNPNVFYELAIRHAARKPVVQIIHVKDKLPFDVANQRTIFYDHQNLRSAHDAVSKIIHQIKAAEANPGDVDTPLSEALLIDALSQIGDPVAKSNSEILAALQNIQAQIIYLRRSDDVRRFNRNRVNEEDLDRDIQAKEEANAWLRAEMQAALESRTDKLIRGIAENYRGEIEEEKPNDSD